MGLAKAMALKLREERIREENLFSQLRRIAALILLYMSASLVMVKLGVIFGDTLARQTSGQIALMSRDAHAAALGFVFNPLPSLMAMPLLPLRHLWLQWASAGFASDLTSAICMAVAANYLYRFAHSRSGNRNFARSITIIFALHPLILIYGGNGMSEAAFVLSLTAATFHLIAWQESGDLHDLVPAALWLAFGYLDRYEAIPAALGALVFLLIHTRVKILSRREGHLPRFPLDGLILVFPTILTIFILILSSWLITGIPFTQLQSSYSNVAILRAEGVHAGGIQLLTKQVIGLEALWPFLLAVCMGMALARRDSTIAVPIAIFTPVLGFETLSVLLGGTFQLVRYFIIIIPFTCYLAILIWPRITSGFHLHLFTRIAIISALIFGSLVSLGTLQDQQIAPAESTIISQLLHQRLTPLQTSQATGFLGARQVAAWLDKQHLPAGSVILDTVYGFAVIAASNNLGQFVSPSDRDFPILLDALGSRKIRYAITVPNERRGTIDILNRRYPGIFDGCLPQTQLIMEITGVNKFDDPKNWRIYDVSTIQRPSANSDLQYDEMVCAAAVRRIQ